MWAGYGLTLEALYWSNFYIFLKELSGFITQHKENKINFFNNSHTFPYKSFLFIFVSKYELELMLVNCSDAY